MANVCVSSEPHIPDLWRIPFEKPPATLMAALFVCAPYGLATRDTVVVRSRPLSLSLFPLFLPLSLSPPPPPLDGRFGCVNGNHQLQKHCVCLPIERELKPASVTKCDNCLYHTRSTINTTVLRLYVELGPLSAHCVA